MRVLTKRFGILKIPPESIWDFPVPLPGFPRSRRYVLLEDERIHPFVWLQSLDETEVAFVLLDATLIDGHYAPQLPEGDLACLELPPGSQPALSVIVTVPADPARAWANLRAPVAMNVYRRLGRQVILQDERLSFRHPLMLAGESFSSVSARAGLSARGAREAVAAAEAISAREGILAREGDCRVGSHPQATPEPVLR